MIASLSRARKTTPIGLDIGISGVSAVQLKRRTEGYVVTRHARCDRESQGDDAPDDSAPLGPCIERTIALAEFRGRSAVAALSPPDIELHALELPPAVLREPPRELAEIVRWEVGRLATFTVDKMEARHWTLPESNATTANAIGVAVTEDRVLQTVEACKGAGLVCHTVDAAAAAFYRFGRLIEHWGETDVWGVLDMGFRQTRLVLCLGGVPVLVRTVGTGGDAWTRRIAQSLQISPKSAEVQKREVGIALTGRGVRSDDSVAPAKELGAILTGVLRADLNDIASEVKRSYEYVLGCYPDHEAKDLVLVGGGGAMQGLAEHLSYALGISVATASSYLGREACRLDFEQGSQGSLERFALAIGAAVRNV